MQKTMDRRVSDGNALQFGLKRLFILKFSEKTLSNKFGEMVLSNRLVKSSIKKTKLYGKLYYVK